MDVTDLLDWDAVSQNPIYQRSAINIYRGRLCNGMAVAIKIRNYSLPLSFHGTQKLLAIWPRCRHPNVVQLAGETTFRGETAVVYGWHEYGSIRDYLAHNSTADRYQLSAQICEGVAYLHANDIIHGDLRGYQILVSNQGVPRIQLSMDTSSTVLFPSGSSGVGRWSAPEILKGSERTLASDVYGLGMTILETLTQDKPYSDDSNWNSVQHKMMKGEFPTRPTDVIPENEAGNVTWDILSKCWAFNFENRPPASHVCNTMRKMYQIPSGSGSTRLVRVSSTTGDFADGVAFGALRLVVTEETSVHDLIAHFERHQLVNYTDLLYQANVATAIPIADTALANVYKAELPNHRCVAVKCVKHCTPYKKLKRAARELSCWSSYVHENILPLLGYAIVKGDLAMISPWMNNGYVTEYVVRNSTCDRLGLCIQLARAIAYLHKHNMVHGDIKGPNVLVSDTGMVKVADFGVSIVEHQEIEFSSTSVGRGTERWQAPEILGEDSDSSKKGDVYAVGMTMTEIYTGEPPYGPENLSFRQIDNIIKGELRPSRPNGLPANTVGNSIWELMNDCWMGSPEQRPTAAEVYERAHGL